MKDSLTQKQQEIRSTAIIYLSGLAEIAYRFGRLTESPKEKSFNFWNMNSIQYLHSYITPFIENIQISLKSAHIQALSELKEDGWKYGEVDDLEQAISTMIVPFEQLSEMDLEKLAFWKSLVTALLNFHDGFSNELESELMDALSFKHSGYDLRTIETIVN